MSYKCPVCNKIFKTLRTLKSHFKLVHRNIHLCPICSAEVKGIDGLIHHCIWMYKKYRCEKHLALRYIIKKPRLLCRKFKESKYIADKIFKHE